MLASGKFSEEERDRPGGVQSAGGLPVRGQQKQRPGSEEEEGEHDGSAVDPKPLEWR